jgi:hypothetical protein
MAAIIRGPKDAAVRSLKKALDEYELAHEGAEASLYRQNDASIRARIIDRRFEGMGKSRRHNHVWDFLQSRVPGDTLSELSLLLPLSPAELKSSFANFEFDDPVQSKL